MKAGRKIVLVVGCLLTWSSAPAAHAELRVTIRLQSGQVHLQNSGEEAFNFTGYTLGSPSGSLFPDNWVPVTDRLDQDGDGSVDSDGSWVVLSPMQPFPPTATDLTEGVFVGDGGFLDSGELIYLGNVWNPFGTLDVTFLYSDAESNLTPLDVYFLPAADFNLDGMVDAADYTVWRNTLGATGPGLLADANGDEIVDEADYLQWKFDFGSSQFMAPAAGALSLAATTIVPEPGSLLLVIGAGGLLLGRFVLRR